MLRTPLGPSPSTSAAQLAALQRTLDVLACPACHHPLGFAESTLVCTGCARAYPLDDGIPILLIDRATLPA